MDIETLMKKRIYLNELYSILLAIYTTKIGFLNLMMQMINED